MFFLNPGVFLTNDLFPVSSCKPASLQSKLYVIESTNFLPTAFLHNLQLSREHF